MEEESPSEIIAEIRRAQELGEPLGADCKNLKSLKLTDQDLSGLDLSLIHI